MKKTLLSIVAGLVVINVASAVPSMDTQKTNCEDGQHVWVEKTKTCVPINPCLSDDINIKEVYCPNLVGLPHNKSKQDLVINEYVQNVLRTGVSEIKEIGDTHMSVKTTDGNYFVWKLSKHPDNHCLSQMIRAFVVNGYSFDNLMFEESVNVSYSSQVDSELKCNNIINFASTMADKDFVGRYENGKCILICEEREF